MLEYFGCRLCLSRSWRSTLLSRSIALRRQHLFILRVPTPGVRSDGKRKTAPVHARVQSDGKLITAPVHARVRRDGKLKTAPVHARVKAMASL